MGCAAPGNPQTPLTAVVPCFNRPGDLDELLCALGQIETELHVIVVDNASAPQLEDSARVPDGLSVSFLRLNSNRGGSGGFHAGIERALQEGAELVWLLDSDAVPEAHCLEQLIAALHDRPDAAAAGSALADPQTGDPYEFGGDIDRSRGELTQHDSAESDEPRIVGYNAACSLLVRREAILRAGLLPDLFLSGDDAAWCHHLALGFGPVLCVPKSRVRHPHPARMRTSVRFYQARNGVTNASRFGLGPFARAARVLMELKRAAAQTMVGRADLADLHLNGVRAAWDNPTGPDERALAHDAYTPLDQLPSPKAEDRVDETTQTWLQGGCISSAPRSPIRSLARWFMSSRTPTAFVNARAHPASWIPARRVISVCEQGFADRNVSRRTTIIELARLATSFLPLAARAALSPPAAPMLPRFQRSGQCSLAIVLLTHGPRVPIAMQTLSRLGAPESASTTELVLVCNGGSEDLPDQLPTDLHSRQVLLDQNEGVEAFNKGVRATDADVVLILDDDAWPDEHSLERAMQLINEGVTDAVAFNRRHPETLDWEWPGESGPSQHNAWPDMGCCNLVRRSAWHAVGGYESEFFLYRNDTDLALSLLGAGFRVRFERDLFAWHNSPTVGKQSPRWFTLATRNWVWMCRRHGRGRDRIIGMLAGWAWAHVRSGSRISCHAATLRGLISGVFHRPPKTRRLGSMTSGQPMASLLSLKSRGRWESPRAAEPVRAHSPAPAE